MARCRGWGLLVVLAACRQEGKTPDADPEEVEEPPAPQAGDIVITEIMGPSWYGAEWFEVRNVGARAYASGELSISDGTILSSLTSEAPLEPGAYAVLSYEPGDDWVGVTHLYDQAIYDAAGGQLRVLAGELELDAVSYGSVGVGSPSDSASLTLDPVAEAADQNDRPECWCLAEEYDGVIERKRRGTPAAENDYCPNLDFDGDGIARDAGDCDDFDAATYPGAEDTWYDGVDQDCDYWSDYDSDRDGYDAETYGGSDCDDADHRLNPGAQEVCDGFDNDCDGRVDDDDRGVSATLYYEDSDGDGYGGELETEACEPPTEGYATIDGDCDDGDPSVSPGADEVWYDGVDQDCDDQNDYDADGDSWESSAYGGEDCNDSVRAVNPGKREHCNGFDDDCDGYTDDADSVVEGIIRWYVDDDGDGFGKAGRDYEGCAGPSGYAPEDGDCIDEDPSVNPAAAEIWYDGVDQNCDGRSDDDADRDGYEAGDVSLDPTADCDDANPLIHPGMPRYLGVADVRCDSTLVLDSLSVMLAEAEGAGLGEAVSSAGDLDGDGVADLLMGAPAADSDSDAEAGLVQVALGGSSGVPDLSAPVATLHGVSNGDAAGEALAGPGDLDGDGYGELAVGASGVDGAGSAAGATYVSTGPVTGDLLLSDADAIWLGVVTRDTAGRAVAASGDGDGDGVAELYVAAPNEDTVGGSAGAVYWLAAGLDGGSLADASGIWLGERTADRAGTDLAGAGDVDGDGVEDLWVGADNGSDSAGSTRPGVVWLLSGVSGGTVSLADAAGRIEGVADGDEFGAGLAAIGDLDGDGYADLWVGAPAQDSGAGLADAGGAWLIPGPVSGASGVSAVSTASVEGEEAGARVGASVAGLGDLDEDGLADLVVGAPGATGGAAGSGALSVLPGAISGAQTLSAVALETQVGVDEDEAAATALAGVGDVNGDGQPDLLVGLPERGAVGAVALIGPP